MAYIGIQPAESFTSFATQTFSVSATTSYTLDHAVANENEIALFVNNVRQQPGSGKAYTATGTALTLSAATATTDTMYCIFLGRALQTVTPATNSVTSSMLGSNFFTGATDVGGALADADLLLIDDGAGGTLRKTAMSRVKTYVGGGITNAQTWRITSAFTVGTSETDISSNWEESDSTAYARIGSIVSQSSGIFTFAATGIYLVLAQAGFRNNVGTRSTSFNLKGTTNNSTYTYIISGEQNNSDFGGSNNTSYHTGALPALFDVTDTTQVKFRFTVQATGDTQTCDGDTDRSYTGFTIVRLGDT